MASCCHGRKLFPGVCKTVIELSRVKETQRVLEKHFFGVTSHDVTMKFTLFGFQWFPRLALCITSLKKRFSRPAIQPPSHVTCSNATISIIFTPPSVRGVVPPSQSTICEVSKCQGTHLVHKVQGACCNHLITDRSVVTKRCQLKIPFAWWYGACPMAASHLPWVSGAKSPSLQRLQRAHGPRLNRSRRHPICHGQDQSLARYYNTIIQYRNVQNNHGTESK